MKRSFLRGATAGAVVAILSMISTLAGPAPAAEPKPAADGLQAGVAAAWERRVPEFTVDNLPLSEVVKFLSQRFPEINFIMKAQTDNDPDLAGLGIRITLRSVNLYEILTGIQLAYQQQLHIRYGSSPDATVPTPDERFVVFEQAPSRSQGPASDLTLVRAYNLSSYLSRQSSKDADEAMAQLEQAIDVACSMAAEANKIPGHQLRPRLNLHRGTKLLIVAGNAQELMLVEQIVKELQGTPGPALVTLPSPKDANHPDKPVSGANKQ